MEDYSLFLNRIKEGRRFIVLSHYNPDGDAIGSTVAMGILLKHLGKEVVLYNRDLLPKNLSFLPQSSSIIHKIDPKDSFDMAIMVDCAEPKRVSDEFANFKGCKEISCIDHHLFEILNVNLQLIDSAAASTGEVILRLAEYARLSIDSDFAQCIYTTLVVDTGFFKYSNTSAVTLELAAKLVSTGANPWVVAKNLEESYPASRMKLLGLSLSTLAFEFEGQYAAMEVTQQMLKKAKATIDLSDEFATYPRAVEGVEVSALFRELDNGKVKVSLRSKDRIDVAAIARKFDGGGHARAAGLQVKGTLQETKKKVLGEIQEALLK